MAVWKESLKTAKIQRRIELLKGLDEYAGSNPRPVQRRVREELPQLEGGLEAGGGGCGRELFRLAQPRLNGQPPPAPRAAEEVPAANGVAGLAEGLDLRVATAGAEGSDCCGRAVPRVLERARGQVLTNNLLLGRVAGADVLADVAEVSDKGA